MATCIVCGSADNLNTELTISVDGQKVIVQVCDVHAEDITPKAAREAYLAKKKEIDKVLEQAKALGLQVVVPTNTSKLAIVTNRPDRPIQRAPVSAESLDGDDVISTEEVDMVMQNKVHGISGKVSGYAVEGHSAYKPSNLADKLPEEVTRGKVKMELAEGRQGQPIAVPSIRVDGTGTTTVKITKGMTDAQLQRSFKDLAASNDGTGNNVHSFGKEGYAVHDCTMCRGAGYINRTKTERVVCPKCNGSGMLSLL